jgi:two-component system, cell cycle sensor histidine kinase and response regulator CckA
MEHLFEPFFTTKEAGKGTGLGLSTVYGIVKTAGGVISVYTEVGMGTTFKVYLPRVDAALDQPENQQGSGDLQGSETILLVEDDELVRELARGILEANGYCVVVAENGGAALLACEQHTGGIDLVLTDVVMPQMSGRELVERLAKVRPGLKVLYFSGYTSGVVLHDDVVGSGAAFLQKPFSAAALGSKVREVLDATAQA